MYSLYKSWQFVLCYVYMFISIIWADSDSIWNIVITAADKLPSIYEI